MTESRTTVSRLQLVRPTTGLGHSNVEWKPVQLELFPPSKSGTITFVDFTRPSLDVLSAVLDEVRPHWILDLRTAPRLDVGHLDRRQVLSWFGELDIRYRDFAGILEQRNVDQKEDRLREIAALSSATLQGGRSGAALPALVYFVDSGVDVGFAANHLGEAIRPRPNEGWGMRYYGQKGDLRPMLMTVVR